MSRPMVMARDGRPARRCRSSDGTPDGAGPYQFGRCCPSTPLTTVAWQRGRYRPDVRAKREASMQPCGVCGGMGIDAAGYCTQCRTYRGVPDQPPPESYDLLPPGGPVVSPPAGTVYGAPSSVRGAP